MNDSLFISNIQRFSTKDGPGIRTTIFFKGCPLRCKWCHNPETHLAGEEIMYNAENCTLCGRCSFACPNGAITIVGEELVTDRTKCHMCGKCTTVCYYNAREMAGKLYTAEEICDAVERDAAFYRESGGGVTLSGGECMMYADFVSEILRFCKNKKIHTAVDTSGYVQFSEFEKVMPYTDIFLYDIKTFSSKLHRELTAVPNELIWENLFKLSEAKADIYLRIPVIEKCNADIDEMTGIAEKCKNLNISHVNLLPYHDMGKYKYTKLGREYDENSMSTPSDEKMKLIAQIFADNGFKNIKIGG